MIVLNLFGEPGVGKSVTAAGVYYHLAIMGLKTEIVSEVAKGFAWETPKNPNGVSLTHPIFEQQIYILGEQNRWLERIKDKREVAIMECPLLMGAIYQKDDYLPSFTNLTIEQFNCYNNLNFLLEREHQYDPDGRVHTESESKGVRAKLLEFFKAHNIPYIRTKTNMETARYIAEYVKEGVTRY